MSTANNNIVRPGGKSIFEDAKPVLGAASDMKQGDIVVLKAGVIQVTAGDADIDLLIGVSKFTLVDGKVKSPYSGTAVDASESIAALGGPDFGGDYKMVLTTGEAFAVGAPVYMTADPQTVTSADPGSAKACGIFVGAAVASASAGQKGLVKIGARLGLAGLTI